MQQSTAVRGVSPPPLYDTSISTHEETSWHSSSYHSRDSGAARASPTTPHGGSTPPASSSSAFRGWFPKSHPKSPRYDPRAYRRDEHHKPLHSEPIRSSNDLVRSRGGAAARTSHGRHHCGQQSFPDPEPNLQHLERENQGGSSSGPLPVFTIDGIASEVALGSARTSSSTMLTRDLVSRLDTRRTIQHQRRTTGRGASATTSASATASRNAPPSSELGVPSATIGNSSDETAQKTRVRERVSAAAASRRNQQPQHQQKQSWSESRGRTTAGRQLPPPPTLLEGTHSRPVTPAEANESSANKNDWQGRSEIETPEPARVVVLKQKLWDDHESLHNKSPGVHRHVALQYDREGLNQRWKQWHGEIDGDNEAAVKVSPPRLDPKPAKRATSSRPRSLSPGTVSARSRTPPPPMLPLTPASAYSTPKQAQVFQSRFVQAAQRASPAAPQQHHCRSTQGAPAAGTSGAVTGRRISSANLSSATPTSAAAATPDHRQVLEEVVAAPEAKRTGPEPPLGIETRGRSSANTGKKSSPQTNSVPHPPSGAVADVTSASIADLVSKLQRVRRDNPGEALAEIDAIIRQSQAHLNQAQQELSPSKGHDPASRATSAAAAVAAIVKIPIQRADTRNEIRGEGTASRRDFGPMPHRSSMASNSHPDDEPTLVEAKDETVNDNAHRNEGEVEDDDSDGDETSVSSITNPTYGAAGTEFHHPRPTVLSTFKGAGQPRPSALTNYTNARSTLRTTELQQPAHGRSRRRARHRSPPPSSIHLSKDTSSKNQAYQRLPEGEDKVLNAELRSTDAPTRRRLSLHVAEDPKNNAPMGTEPNDRAATSVTTTNPITGTSKQQATEPVTDPRNLEPELGRLAEWNVLTSTHTAAGEACPRSSDIPLNTTLEMSALMPSRSRDMSDWALDPSSSAELVQKIKKWDEMSEPDFCPAVGCLNSRSSDNDLHRSPPLRVDSLADMICPRDGDGASKRRHHPWDTSIPVCMGQVSVRETSMDHAAGVEAEFSTKYHDARSETSVSVEASTGGFRNDSNTSHEKSKPVTESKAEEASGELRTSRAARGNPVQANQKLVTSPATLRGTDSSCSSHQAYARDLADDFDSAWVSLPASSFFPGNLQGAFSAENTPGELPSQAKVLSLSKPGDGSANVPRQSHRDEHYQTFRAKEGGSKKEASASGGIENTRSDFRRAIGTTKTFQLGGSKDGEKAGVEVAIVNDLQQPVKSLHPSLSEANKGRRGLRNFLKMKQMARTPSMGQESVSTSSRSHLQSVARDLQSASLDLETTEAPPPAASRGRSRKDETQSNSADRLRSRSLDDRRIRNPHIAKKFSRLLRVYEDNPSKHFGII